MNFRKLATGLVLAGLLQVGAAQALTVVPIDSALFVEARVKLDASPHHTRFGTDEQANTTNALSAKASVRLEDSGKSVAAYSSAAASWESAGKGSVVIGNGFESTNVDSGFARTVVWGYHPTFEYNFTLSEAATITFDFDNILVPGSEFRQWEAGSTTFRMQSGLKGFHYLVPNDVTGKNSVSVDMWAGTWSLNISGTINSSPDMGTRKGGHEMTVDWEIADMAPVPVPLPAVLLLTGLGGLGLVARRRRRV